MKILQLREREFQRYSTTDFALQMMQSALMLLVECIDSLIVKEGHFTCL